MPNMIPDNPEAPNRFLAGADDHRIELAGLQASTRLLVLSIAAEVKLNRPGSLTGVAAIIQDP